MTSATAPAAPPAITAAEKTAVLTAAFLVGVLLAIPLTRGLAVDAVVTTATFVVDTAINVARALGSLVGLA
jgi:hypothetical protein